MEADEILTRHRSRDFLEYIRVVPCPMEDSMDKDDCGLKAVEGEIIADDEVSIAKPGNVLITGNSTKHWVARKGA